MAISSIPIRVPKLCTDSRPRTLHQFESRQEVLFALRDAIAAHQVQWNASQVAHGNISIDTICIGDTESPGARGFLISLEESTKPNGVPTFHSAAAVSREIFPSSKFLPLDYFDDLESFYYVLAYICIAFTEPYTCLSNIPRTVSVWATNPQSEKAALAKRAIMSGSGIEYGHVQPYFGTFIFETLLEDLHTILKYRNEKRTARELNSSSFTTREMVRKESDEDYEDFLERFDWAIEVMEDFGDGQFDEIDTQMTTFKVNQEPSMKREGDSCSTDT